MKYCLLILLFTTSLFSQEVIIKDAVTKAPISGVAIFNENKSKSEVSNKEGLLNLNVFNDDELLIVKHISYKEIFILKSQIISSTIYLESSLQGLDEIVLSASKFKENKSDIAKSISRVDAKTIGFTNPQTSADLLERTGKVFIQKSQLGGGSPVIRGFSTNRLLINVDGVRMNNAIFRSGNIQNVISVDPFSIENTEVTLGPGTIIYGSDAIGGVMSFKTLKPKLSYQDSIMLNASSTVRYATASNEQTIHSNINIGLEKWAFLTSATFTDFDDLRMGKNGPDTYLRPEFVVTNGTEDFSVKNKNPLVQKETGYDQINFMQKVLFAPNNKIDLNLGLFYTRTGNVPRYDRLLRYRDENLRSAEWFYGPQKWIMAHLSADYNYANNLFFNNAKINLAFQKFNESRIERDFQDLIRNTREEQVNAFSLNLDFEKNLIKNLKLFYGVEYIYNKVFSSAFQTNIETNENENIVTRYPNGSSWQSTAAYFNLKYKPTKEFIVQSGLRYNSISSQANFSENNSFLNLPFTEAKNNNDAVTGSLGFSWLPSQIIQWRLNLSTAFRAPNIDDIGKVFDSEPGSVVVPNNFLEPEYAYGVELGLTLNAENTAIFDFSTYYTFLDNALVRRDGTLNGVSELMYDGELSQIQSIQNASEAEIYGLEIGVQFNFSKSIYSKSQYNIIGGNEINNNIESPTRHVVPNFGNSHLVWFNKKFKVDGFINFSSSLTNNQLANSEQDKDYIYDLNSAGNPFSPSWYTVNFTTQYQLNPNASVTASLENITDQRYKTYSSGIAAPGKKFNYCPKI